jgi:hypothetical protein
MLHICLGSRARDSCSASLIISMYLVGLSEKTFSTKATPTHNFHPVVRDVHLHATVLVLAFNFDSEKPLPETTAPFGNRLAS